MCGVTECVLPEISCVVARSVCCWKYIVWWHGICVAGNIMSGGTECVLPEIYLVARNVCCQKYNVCWHGMCVIAKGKRQFISDRYD
jgi:hypothetical protein